MRSRPPPPLPRPSAAMPAASPHPPPTPIRATRPPAPLHLLRASRPPHHQSLTSGSEAGPGAVPGSEADASAFLDKRNATFNADFAAAHAVPPAALARHSASPCVESVSGAGAASVPDSEDDALPFLHATDAASEADLAAARVSPPALAHRPASAPSGAVSVPPVSPSVPGCRDRWRAAAVATRPATAADMPVADTVLAAAAAAVAVRLRCRVHLAAAAAAASRRQRSPYRGRWQAAAVAYFPPARSRRRVACVDACTHACMQARAVDVPPRRHDSPRARMRVL